MNVLSINVGGFEDSNSSSLCLLLAFSLLFSKKLFNHFYKMNYELENQFIKRLIKEKKLLTYIHKGFFFNIDKKIDLITIKKKYKKVLYKL